MIVSKTKESPGALSQKEPAPRRWPWRQLLIGGGVVLAAVGLVAVASHLPVMSRTVQNQELAAKTGSPSVGATAGYNITNESGLILIYQRVGGHIAAPLQPGGLWIPGQTLNFELNTGTFGTDANTGDAFFEAFTATDPNSLTDAGTVDIHFKQAEAGGGSWAYLNPSDTAPLRASSNATPASFDGESWPMESNYTNIITSSNAPQSYPINSNWAYAGVTANSLGASIQSAGGQCSLQDQVVTVCTLGDITWQFGPND